jgi:hypothetical protein
LACIKAGRASKRKYSILHAEASRKAEDEWYDMIKEPNFLLFLMFYACEGTRKGKHSVTVVNTDLELFRFSYKWLEKINYNNHKIILVVRIHLDEDEATVREFWANFLGRKEPIKIVQRKDSCNLRSRNHATHYGIPVATICDTYLKTKMDVWLKKLREVYSGT